MLHCSVMCHVMNVEYCLQIWQTSGNMYTEKTATVSQEEMVSSVITE